MKCGVCIKELWDEMSRKIDLLKELHILVKALNKHFEVPGETKYGVCKKFITKFTDYFLAINDLGTTSFGNELLFTQHKENCRLINGLVPCSLILMSIHTIVVESLQLLKKMLKKTKNANMAMHILQVNMPFANGLLRTLGKG